MSMTDWTVSSRWQYPVTFTATGQLARRAPGMATRIIEEVASVWGLKAKDLTSKGRTRYVAWARFEACYRLRTECPWLSLPAIGVRLGGRDHTSVLHGIRRYQELSDTGELEAVKALGRYGIRKRKARDQDQQGGERSPGPAQASRRSEGIIHERG